jgi:hypothetical protein
MFLPEAATAVETLLISIVAVKRMFKNAGFMVSSHGMS